MLAIVFAALTATVWGVGDFCGGKAARKSRTLAVTVVSQLAGLPVLAACIALLGGEVPAVGTIGLGVLGGLSGFAGILLLYRGLSEGAMALFAPTTAVTAAVVPLVVGLLLDRTPSVSALVGVGCAIVAIGLVSLSGGPLRVTPRALGLALASGLGFGGFFALLGRAGAQASLWPVVGGRIGSVGVGLLVVALTRTSLAVEPVGRRWALLAGPLDVLANVLYVLAVASGPLAVVAPIGALYPVSTVLLAMAVDRERIAPVQLAGLGLAATALVLVAS